MGLAAMKVPTIFTAQDRFSSVINTMTKNTNTFSSGLTRMNNRINNQFNSLNRISQIAVAGGAGALFFKAGQDVIDYETKINSLAAVTGTVVGSMNKQIQELGRKTHRSVIDIAGSFEIVGSKMSQYLDNPVALQKVTDASILMAEAARMELEPAIDSLTGVMNIYRMTAENASKVVNKLSAGETVGSVSIAQTADILTQFGAQAVRANVPIEESIALIQTLTKSLGVEGVGRGLRNILFDISSTKTWDKNRWKAIKMAGVDFEFITNNANDLVDRLRELKKLSGVKGAMELFFKRTGTVAANTLFQNFDKDGFTDFLGKIRELDDAQAKAAKNNATFATMWARTKDAFTNYIVVQDKTNTGLELMKGLLGWVKDNMGSIINLIGAVTVAFLGWKVIVGIVSLVSGVMEALSAIMAVHRFVVLWATLTNTGYAASLYAVATATLAAYWPVLLVVGALGLLAYAFWDTGNATDDMVSKQVSALSKGDAAMMNSTNVMSRELSKQKQLMEKSGAKVSINTDIAQTLKRNAVLEKQKKEAIQAVPIQVLSSNAKLFDNSGKTVSGVDKFSEERKLAINFGDKKENLAGKSNENLVNDISSKINKQQVELVVRDPGNNLESAKVNGNNYSGGIPAKTGSTTGVKNQ